MDTFGTGKPGRLPESLSSAWASFLAAQHCTREVDGLRKALDAHTRHTNVSIESLQRDAANQHGLVTNGLADCKAQTSRYAVQLHEITTLQSRLDTLQQDLVAVREHASAKIAESDGKVMVLEGSLEGLRHTTSLDIRTLQEEHRWASEKVELLQKEVRELRAERTAAEQKLAALERQVTALNGILQEMPEASIKALGEILSLRDELMRNLDAHHVRAMAENSESTRESVLFP